MFNKTSLLQHIDARFFMVLLLLLSFSLGEVYRQLLVIVAIFGIYLCIRRYKFLKQEPAIRFLILIFLCIWIPMLLALPDAEHLERSASVTGRFLIFPLAGSVLVYWILRPDMAKRLLWGTVGIMLFWTIDGLVQFTLGHDILGNPAYPNGRLTGTFSHWPHIGVILAIFLPVYLEGLYQLSLKTRWAWLLILPVLVVILLGGGRSSWMLTAIALIFYFIYFKNMGRRFSWLRSLLFGTISIALISVVTLNVEWLSQRVDSTLGLFSGDYKTFRLATSRRPPIWSTALNMSSRHWINGVGPRGFQSSYKEYSTTPDDPFLNEPAGHPHLFVLEVSAETGLIGITGYVIFFILLIRHMRFTTGSHYADVVPWGLAGLVAAFPLSSTMSFYAYFSSCLMWTLVIIYIALSRPLSRSEQYMAKDDNRVEVTVKNQNDPSLTRQTPG